MKKLVVGSIVTATLLLVGCGSGSSSNNNNGNSIDTPTNTQKIGTGYYVDDAVNGVDYKCGSQEGVTDENGTFTFESGKNCTFSLGGLKLREVNASSLDNNVSILEDNTTVAQLLQTLDKDGNASNGIQIPQGAGQVIRDTLTSLDKPLDRDLLTAIHDTIKADAQNDYNGRVMDMNETQKHLDETKQRLEQEGRRTQHDVETENHSSGQFNGDNNGTMNGSGEGHERGSFDDNNGTMNRGDETHERSGFSDNNGTMNRGGAELPSAGTSGSGETDSSATGNEESSSDNEHGNGSGSSHGEARG